MSVRKLPPLLCLHLKRFEQLHGQPARKLEMPVSFPFRLDAEPYMTHTILMQRFGLCRYPSSAAEAAAADNGGIKREADTSEGAMPESGIISGTMWPERSIAMMQQRKHNMLFSEYCGAVHTSESDISNELPLTAHSHAGCTFQAVACTINTKCCEVAELPLTLALRNCSRLRPDWRQRACCGNSACTYGCHR